MMAGVILLFGLSCIIRETTIFSIFLRTTTNMHKAMTEKVLRSNILFFDSNPIGRILTRFSKDMAVLDLICPTVAIMMTYGIFRAIAVSLCLIFVNYWLVIPIVISFAYLTYLLTKA